MNDQPPTVTNGGVSTTPDVAVSNTLPGAAYYAGQNLIFSVAANPAHGNVSITNATTGAFTYTPGQGFAGTDVFTFKVADQWGTTATATENVTVSDVAPTISGTTAVNMTHNTTYNGSFTSTPKYTGQVLTFGVITNPAHGVLTLNVSTGTYTYKPTQGYKGTDRFSARVTDQWATVSNTLTVSVTIK